jgi:3-deoxy-D-manno-octulosonate 8-phosphate phosphatase (KDO 8-P phosphatase)
MLRPTLTFPSDLLLKAQGIRVVFLDVDGVLTDGGLYFSEAGETLKRFNTLDGQGLKLLQRVGITPAVISGRDSRPLRMRLAGLGIEHAYFDTENKGSAAERILQTLGFTWQQAAAMGDDWLDLALLRRSALACAPRNAHPEVKAIADYVTSAGGGQGAVRQLCDLLLVASGRYAAMLEESWL